jgi:hypothetical protein
LRTSVSERGNPYLQLTSIDCRATAAPARAMTDFSHSLSGLIDGDMSVAVMVTVAQISIITAILSVSST